jgi:hypothetical protein
MKTFKKLSQKHMKKILLIGLFIVGAAHLTSVLVADAYPSLASGLSFFDVDRERNFPTAYNGMMWLAASAATFVLIKRAKGQFDRLRWVFLSVLFLYFAIDDLFILHEQLADPVRRLLHVSDSSIYYHAWIVPALVVTLGFGLYLIYFRDRSNIAKEQRNIYYLVFLTAAGVIALEGFGTKLYSSGVIYKLGPVFIEEMFEMSMASLIFYKLRSYNHP